MNRQITNVDGPPGTGKTRYCIETVCRWIEEGVDPERIGYFSFTTNATQEARDRIATATATQGLEFPWFKTLHAAAYRIAGIRKEQVVQGRELMKLAKDLRIAYNPYEADIEDLYEGSVLEGNLILSIYDFGRARKVVDPEAAWEQAPSSLTDRVNRRTYRFFVGEYEEWKRKHRLVDFTDMLGLALDAHDTTGCTHVVIDEAQDLTPLQWDMATLVCEDAAVIVRAGDSDQTCFSWAGVEPGDFERLDGERILLAQSYRVPATVHTEAMAIIGRNKHRLDKPYHPRPATGAFRRWQKDALPPLPQEGTSAFLFRNKKHLNALADEFIERRILFGSNRYKTPLTNPVAVQGLRALYRYLDHGKTSTAGASAILDMIDKGPHKGEIRYGAKAQAYRAMKERPFQEVTDLGLTPEGMRLAKKDPTELLGGRWHHRGYLKDLLRRHGTDLFSQVPAVYLTTVHGAKGNEWDHVFISQDCLRTCADGEASDPEEETRLRYIAVTRAKESVTVLSEQAEGGWAI